MNAPVAAMAGVVLVLAGLVLLHLKGTVDTYDQRYAACMDVQASWQPGERFLPYPSPEYDAATRTCDQEASR